MATEQLAAQEFN